MNPLVSAILGIGRVVDTPRAMVFAAARGENPFTAMLDPDRRHYGAEVTGNPITGFLLDALADPMTYLGAGLVGALRAKAKAANARRAEMLAKRFMPEEVAKRTVVKQAIPRFRDKKEWAKALRREMVAAGHPLAATLSDDTIIASYYDMAADLVPENPALVKRLLSATYRRGSAPARMYHGTPIAYDWPTMEESSLRSYNRSEAASVHPALHFVTADPEYASKYAEDTAQYIRENALNADALRQARRTVKRRARKAFNAYLQAIGPALTMVRKAGLPVKVPALFSDMDELGSYGSRYIRDMSALAAARGDERSAMTLAHLGRKLETLEQRLGPAIRMGSAMAKGLEHWTMTGNLPENVSDAARQVVRRAQMRERIAPNVRMYYVDARRPISPNAWIDLVREHGSAEKALAAARAMGYDALADIPELPAAGYEVMPFSLSQLYAPYIAPRARRVPGAGTLAAVLASYHLPLGGFRQWQAQ